MRRLFIFALLSLVNCTLLEDSFDSDALTSSEGEKIYINSVNWGVGADKQLSIVTKDPNRLRERDTLDAVYGLDPFIYSFENDTLTLFFTDEAHYAIKESFETITVEYKVVSRDKLRELDTRSEVNYGYHSVPRSKKELPND